MTNFSFYNNILTCSAPPEDYVNYRTQLRKEFSDQDDTAYIKMRLKVLKSLLLVPNIYSSEAFFHLESPARANIEKEVAELSL